MNPPLSSGETLQAFGPSEQFIIDASGNIVGIVNRRANGLDLRPGSGGASTFAALTDKTTVDLPAVNTPLANALAAKAAADPADGVLTGPYTLTALDNRKTYTCDTALPVSCPNGLSPKPSTIFFPPLTGNLTLTPTGGATLNGSTSPITRAFTGTNKLGVALVPNPYDVNDSIVSGS